MRLLLARPLDGQEVGGFLGSALAALDGIGRHLPDVRLLEEGVRVGCVVEPQHLALHLEQVLRVTQVGHQFGADLGFRGDEPRIDLGPGLEDGIRLVPAVEGDGAVVGVHRGLDRVADVVDLCSGGRAVTAGAGVLGGLGPVDPGRVRVVGGGGVRVDDPDDAPVDHRRVGVGVHRQERRHLLDPVHGNPVEQQPRVGVDPLGEQQVDVPETHCESELVQEVADGNATASLIGVLGLGVFLPATGGVELNRIRSLGGPGDDPVLGFLAEVDAGLFLLDQAFGRDASREVGGFSVRLTPVAVGRHQAVAVGVDRVHVVPGVARLDGVQVEFACGHHGVRLLAVHVVAVDVQGLGEAVVAAHLLELLEGRGDDGRIHQPDRGKRRSVGAQLAGAHAVHGLVVGDLHRVDAEGPARRLDVVCYPGALQIGFVGFDHEIADPPRIYGGEDHRGDHQQAHRDTGHTPPDPPCVVETQQGADPRYRGDDQTGRDPGGRIRVVDAREQIVLGGQVAVAVEEGGHPVEQQRHPEQDGDLPLGSPARGLEVPRFPEGRGVHGPGEEMNQQRPDETDHHHETHVAQHESPPGQLEHVEGRIQPEHGVGGAEFGGAGPRQKGLGLAGGNPTAQQAGHDGRQQHEGPGTLVQAVTQLKQQLGIQVRAPNRGTQPVGQHQGTEQPAAHQQPEPQEQPHPGGQLGGEHRRGGHAAEP